MLPQTWLASLMLLWLWFGVVAVLALGVAVLFAMSGCTTRGGASRMTPLGVLALLVAILPQFYSYLALTQYLDNAVGFVRQGVVETVYRCVVDSARSCWWCIITI